MMSEHTPLPWTYGYRFIAHRVGDDEYVHIAKTPSGKLEPENGLWDANAALIVRSVNQSPLFDELVEALREAGGTITSIMRHYEFPETEITKRLATIDALIAKATA